MSVNIIPLMAISLDTVSLPNLVQYLLPTGAGAAGRYNVLSQASQYTSVLPGGAPVFRIEVAATGVSAATNTTSLALSCVLGTIGRTVTTNAAGSLISTSSICTTPVPAYLMDDAAITTSSRILAMEVDILKAISDGVIVSDMTLDLRYGRNNAANIIVTWGWYLPSIGFNFPLGANTIDGTGFSSCPVFTTAPKATRTLKLDGTWS